MSDRLSLVASVLLLAAIGWGCVLLDRLADDIEAKCATAGGVLIDTPKGYICAKVQVLYD